MHAAGRDLEPDKILPLADENDDADAGGKADDDRIGYVLDDRPEACRAHRHEDEARHQRRQLQPGNTVLCGDDREHRDEGARGSRDLHPRTAE